MPANKKIGYKQALQVRMDLIAELERCKSVGKFIEIEKAHHKNKHVLQLFKVDPGFKKRDKDLLATRDTQIANLFEEKRQQFASQLEQIIEKRRLEEEQLKQEEQQSLSSDENYSNEVDEPVVDIEDTAINNDKLTLTTVVNASSRPEEEQPEIDAQRVNELVHVKKHLDSLSDKSAEFAGKIHTLRQQNPVDIQKLADYENAKIAIDSIHRGINGLYEQCIYGRISLTELRNQAKPYLNSESEHVQTLQSHRGVKGILEILTNIVAALGLSIFYGIAALAKGNLMVFKLPTDSANRLNTLDESIERAIAVSSA